VNRRNLSGKVVLISGAAGGLGTALCLRYAAAGSLIAAMDLDAVRLDALTLRLQQMGTRTLALPGNIRDQRGFIAAISSVAGFSPLVGRTGYAASKHALHGFFDSLRSEVEDAGVSVTLVCPSFIRSGFGAAALDGAGGSVTGRARLTSGGESTAEDIAERIFVAVAEHRRLLLPDRTSRLAWWISRVAPGWYADTMKRRLGAEFQGLPR